MRKHYRRRPLTYRMQPRQRVSLVLRDPAVLGLVQSLAGFRWRAGQHNAMFGATRLQSGRRQVVKRSERRWLCVREGFGWVLLHRGESGVQSLFLDTHI